MIPLARDLAAAHAAPAEAVHSRTHASSSPSLARTAMASTTSGSAAPQRAALRSTASSCSRRGLSGRMADRTITFDRYATLCTGAAGPSLSLPVIADVRLIPQNTSPSGITQLQMIVAGLVLIAPATTWNGTIAMNTKPHSALSLRLISLNWDEPQYCSG